jgi:hypothetical protein
LYDIPQKFDEKSTVPSNNLARDMKYPAGLFMTLLDHAKKFWELASSLKGAFLKLFKETTLSKAQRIHAYGMFSSKFVSDPGDTVPDPGEHNFQLYIFRRIRNLILKKMLSMNSGGGVVRYMD